MAKLRISGLANCDTCRKARRELSAAGHEVSFRDLREDRPGREEILKLWQELGDSLLNRSSTTWRGLDEAERARPVVDLLLEHPALMKRPLVESDERRTLGWSAAMQKVWLQ